MNIRVLSIAAALCASATLAACGSAESGSSGSGSGGGITIGASIPLSGDLAGFGAFQKWGYEKAVKEANAQGGLTVGGTKRKVSLKLLDDKTDPNVTSSNVSRLITADSADALLGSCTPALVTAGALIAQRNRVPMVTGCAPLQSFKAVAKWTYAWDIFFDEADLTNAPFQTLNTAGAQTNKQVAVLADNGPDGQALSKVIPKVAAANGYRVVVNETFPTNATQFSSLVAKAKASGADLLVVDAVTPQAIAIRKQMQSAGYEPKYAVMEKGAEPVQFAQALGKLADGVMVGGYWDPSFPFPGASDLRTSFEQETGNTFSQHIADSYTAAKVLLDAIQRAGSTDPEKINAAIAKTNGTYVVGPVRFDADNTAKLPIAELQWQGGETKVVGPTDENLTGKLVQLGGGS